MKLSFVMACISVLSASSGAAQAETLYLDCQQISKPKHGPVDLYAKPPATQDQVIRDIWEAGFSGFVVDPPTTWVVDLEANTITSPDNSPTYKITGKAAAEITGSFVSESRNVSLWGLNRISGTVVVTHTLQAAQQKEWQAKHGKPFPIMWMWSQKCKASDRPAM
ncbi:hypothetical protein [Sphingobium lactosutens]|uniref:Uncharacterized protein n=1 Tax=Sphingobium lactosutens DS20 TaxID=1331060 RepID=T0IHR9_9SPHN|nr:hypothetical protein [Sphingobium lactosutens]EQB11250.1 hypothetical protein RLDS_22880 [Sphingobium lactosutens DS20]